MGHYITELAVWILLAYLLGCLIGWLLRHWFGGRLEIIEERTQPVAPPAAQPPAEPQPLAVAVAPVPAVAPEPVPAVSRMERPKGLAEARGGKPDKLQRISGIGPKNERVLHNLGFFHFEQIAAWSDDQISWVDNHLKFNGRIGREKWVRQAQLLANGEEAEFRRLFGAGQPKN